ncbi:MAG: anaerobic sulfatase maturase [Syntrophobacteraceae bacterium]
MMTAASAPRAFHFMVKPSGSACNLQCDYCFFLKKADLYPGSNFRMTEAVHEAFIRQLLQYPRSPGATVAWQGGEPTLMGLGFYRRSLELQRRYRRPGVRIENTFQTNGVLLDDQWCRFFKENDFLVGLSLDGPGELHDFYRKDKAGRGTFRRVVRAVRLLQKHRVEFNILCAVNSRNGDHPLEVYRFFRDELRADYIQFIPIVERAGASGYQEGGAVTEPSVGPEQFGRFLIEIFNEWVAHDVGSTFVLNFDATLAAWMGHPGAVCTLAPTCGLALTLEHNGDLYSCDHFVEPAYLLGNILTTPMLELAASARQKKFGRDKSDTLPGYCGRCDFLAVCYGECPKNRFVKAPNNEKGLNYLCAGYRAFFLHAGPALKIMAQLLGCGKTADCITQIFLNGEVEF